ncbi:MAG: hypothetical protein K2K68_04905 [Duncaniella sp.]|nr:hypothetical protein [Duncaniella sp.]
MKKTEEDKFNALFGDFNPEMKSDNLFMSRLENKLATLEPVKSQIEKAHRSNRLAVIVAAVTGSIFGVIGAVCYPFIISFISAISSTSASLPSWIGEYATSITWGTVGIIGIILIMTAYDITLLATRRVEK